MTSKALCIYLQQIYMYLKFSTLFTKYMYRTCVTSLRPFTNIEMLIYNLYIHAYKSSLRFMNGQSYILCCHFHTTPWHCPHTWTRMASGCLQSALLPPLCNQLPQCYVQSCYGNHLLGHPAGNRIFSFPLLNKHR